MSSFKMYISENNVIPNTISELKYLVKSEQQVNILTNFSDDFGDDEIININGEKIILPANTTKLHYS